MSQKIDLGLRLAEERKRIGMNQGDFGQQGGVSKGSQLLYEKGNGAPTSDYLAAIAHLGADIQYIINGLRSLPVAESCSEPDFEPEELILGSTSSIGGRLREEREKLGLSQSAFGAIGGVLKQAQLNYEKGERFPDAAYLEAVYKAGVDVQYIISGEYPPMVSCGNENELDPSEYVFFPKLDIKLSAGSGNVVWEVDQKVQRQAFLRTWVERVGVDTESAAVMTANGRNMEPRIMDGDSLVVDYKRTSISDGKIYALALEGEVFVKRIHKEIGGVLRISSDNTDKVKYPDKLIPVDLVNQVQIIGRVMAVSGGV